MWGGLDLGNLSALGSQLGEAIQKAKDNLDTTLDNAFKFDEAATSNKPAASASETAPQEEDDFAVDAGGLFIATAGGLCTHAMFAMGRAMAYPLARAQAVQPVNLHPPR